MVGCFQAIRVKRTVLWQFCVIEWVGTQRRESGLLEHLLIIIIIITSSLNCKFLFQLSAVIFHFRDTNPYPQKFDILSFKQEQLFILIMSTELLKLLVILNHITKWTFGHTYSSPLSKQSVKKGDLKNKFNTNYLLCLVLL